MTTSRSSGFADPGRDAQAVFRAVMDAMARPGLVVRLPAVLDPPAPLGVGCAAVTLTLCDFETPLWLDAPLAEAEDVAAFLRFHTGAPIVADPVAAAFALVADPFRTPTLDAFALGTPDYPDRSTTLIVAVEGVEDGTGLGLRGPGIDGEARLAIAGLPPDFFARRARLADLFPRGLDMIFAAGDRVAALPRTTRVEG